MTSELETWERKHYVAGGGDPMLFFVVYGEINTSAPLSRSRYRSNGAPDGIDVMSYDPSTHPDVPCSFRNGYIWDEFVANDPELAATVGRCEHCMILRGPPTDSTTLNYLRDTVGLHLFDRSRRMCGLRSVHVLLVAAVGLEATNI